METADQVQSFLVTEELWKIFDKGKEVEVTGLAGVTVSFGKGDFAVLSGPSGSGKTTLLNIIGGLDSATSGTVLLDGEEITAMSAGELTRLRRDHIGFVFQAYNLVPVLSAWENIAYIMKLQGTLDALVRERVQEVAVRLGIDGLLHKLPGQLSGGQQQRVAVARAVAAKPKLILADEPTANLDTASGAALMDMMEQLNREEKITIIFSSHDPKVIEKARHSIILEDGRVVADVIR